MCSIIISYHFSISSHQLLPAMCPNMPATQQYPNSMLHVFSQESGSRLDTTCATLPWCAPNLQSVACLGCSTKRARSPLVPASPGPASSIVKHCVGWLVHGDCLCCFRLLHISGLFHVLSDPTLLEEISHPGLTLGIKIQNMYSRINMYAGHFLHLPASID